MSAGLDVGYVAAVVRQLLLDAGRDILLEDWACGEVAKSPPDTAAAPDGLLLWRINSPSFESPMVN